MSIAFLLILGFALLMALVVVIYNIGTGRHLFDDIENAAFIYSVQRRQYMRSRRDALRETIKEILK